MKKQLLVAITALAMIFGTVSLIGCGGGQEHKEGSTEMDMTENDGHAEHAHYACPMDCEDGMVYDEPGQCPECKMDLAQVSEEEAHAEEVETHNHEHAYACPMHADVTGHEGDKCTKCGMNLEEVEE